MQREDSIYQLNDNVLRYFLLFQNMFSRLSDLRLTITIQTQQKKLQLEGHAIYESMELGRGNLVI